jgi:hypothetical protein
MLYGQGEVACRTKAATREGGSLSPVHCARWHVWGAEVSFAESSALLQELAEVNANQVQRVGIRSKHSNPCFGTFLVHPTGLCQPLGHNSLIRNNLSSVHCDLKRDSMLLKHAFWPEILPVSPNGLLNCGQFLLDCIEVLFFGGFASKGLNHAGNATSLVALNTCEDDGRGLCTWGQPNRSPVGSAR